MTRWLIIWCVFVVVLVGSAATSFASDCASDPNECTPKGLCEVATEVRDGNKLWSATTTSNKHVSFAQELGMNCGVVELKDPCDNDPNECKIKQLCEKATIDKDGTKSWNSEAKAYVVVAKEYGLNCGVAVDAKDAIITLKTSDVCTHSEFKGCNALELCERATWGKNATFWYSDTNNFVIEAKRRGLDCGVTDLKVALSCEDNPTTCTDDKLCIWATSGFSSNVWTKSFRHQKHIFEAKSRGLSCGVKEKASETKPKTTSAIKLKQFFTSKSKLERQQIQYALKKLGYYKSGVDGIWGPKTKAAVSSFVSKENVKLKSILFVLSEMVNIPSSFYVPKNTAKQKAPAKVVKTQPKYLPSQGYTSYGNPKMSVAQALASCRGNVMNARDRASDAARFDNGNDSYSARCSGSSYGSRYGTTSYGSNCKLKKNSPYGNDLGTALAIGIMEGLSRGMAGKKAAERELKSCMAHYGWRKS
jgi:hypothetical protein